MTQAPKMPLNIEKSALQMQEFYTAAEIANMELPGLPGTERAIQIKAKTENWHDRKNMAGAPLVRRRSGRGGGFEYHYVLLPQWAQMELVRRAQKAVADDQPEKAKVDDITRDEIWKFYDSLSDKKKARAKARLDVLLSVLALEKGGMPKNVAVQIVGSQQGVSNRSIYNWFAMTHGRGREDWLATLVPHNPGRVVKAKCHPEAWKFIRTDYLRAERPTFNSCYRRLERAAAAQGWEIPSERTLKRRMNALPDAAVILGRYGAEQWKQECYPAQERDRSVFHALEAVNADGHNWDVFTEWPDGTTSRTMMVAFQDLYSGKILGWRVDRSENKEAVRLAFGDVVENYGIPAHCYLDNGRAFASKWLTGRTPNRFRFKIRDEDPSGIMTDMGVEVHWTLPYAGQSKPIERAFRDMCDDIAKDPRFAGAWTGNHVGNKPENYGKRAVPIDEFIQVVEEGIIEHNARAGRRARCCHGRSFDETFQESYVISPIRKATEIQKRLYLLAAEGVRAARRDGALKLMGNRYWADFLRDHKGQNLVIRFDPQALHSGLHVYRLDGDYLGFADLYEAAGFNDVGAAQEHARARKKILKADKAILAAERVMEMDEVIGYMAVPSTTTAPLDSKVVAPIFGDKSADQKIMNKVEVLKASTPEAQPLSDSQQAHMDALEEELNQQARNIVKLPETAKQRFQKAHALEAAIAAGEDVGSDEAMWLGGYQTTPEYRAQKGMLQDFGEDYLQY